MCDLYLHLNKYWGNSHNSEFCALKNAMVKTCYGFCVCLFRNENWTQSSCQTFPYVRIFENFFVTTDVRRNRLKVAADLRKFGQNCSVVLKTFWARFSENSQIWYADTYY